MTTATRRTFIALAMSACTALTIVSLAGADVRFIQKPGGTLVKMTYNVESTPNYCIPTTDELVAPGFQAVHYCAGSTFPNAVVAVAGISGGSLYTLVYCFGDGKAGTGENTIETLPDSMIAGVGLYTPPGGTALYPAPGGTGSVDSTMRVTVTRNATQVIIGFPGGGMQTRSISTLVKSMAKYTVIVYPDSNAANADVDLKGAGSAFFGTVLVQAGAVVGDGPLQTSGGLNNSDFILQPQPGGKFTVRPIPGLNKIVNVPNGNLATIVTIADPLSVSQVPGTSPIGLALLTLALMGSGVWVMRSRQKSATT